MPPSMSCSQQQKSGMRHAFIKAWLYNRQWKWKAEECDWWVSTVQESTRNTAMPIIPANHISRYMCLDGRDWCCSVTSVLFRINIQRECDGDLKHSPVMFYNKGFPWGLDHNRGGGGQITTKTRVSAEIPSTWATCFITWKQKRKALNLANSVHVLRR